MIRAIMISLSMYLFTRGAFRLAYAARRIGIAMPWKLVVDRDDLFLLAMFVGFVGVVLSIWYF